MFVIPSFFLADIFNIRHLIIGRKRNLAPAPDFLYTGCMKTTRLEIRLGERDYDRLKKAAGERGIGEYVRERLGLEPVAVGGRRRGAGRPKKPVVDEQNISE